MSQAEIRLAALQLVVRLYETLGIEPAASFPTANSIVDDAAVLAQFIEQGALVPEPCNP